MKGLASFYGYFKAAEAARSIGKKSSISSIKGVVRARIIYDIGPKEYSYYQLYNKPERVWRSYQIDKPLERALKICNPLALREILRDKNRFFDHCKLHDLPVAPTFILEGLQAVDLEEFRSSSDFVQDRFFFKPVKGAHGEGAFPAVCHAGRWSFGEHQNRSLDDLKSYCKSIDDGEDGWICQPFLKNHSALMSFCSPNALSTLRLISVLSNNEVTILYSLLKIARGRSSVDNFSSGSTGNALASVETTTGVLGNLKYSLDNSWPAIQSSPPIPDPEISASNLIIPYWNEAKEAVIRAHKTLPEFVSLGWDVAVTNSGVCIIEANSNYGGETLQIAYERGLKDEIIFHLSNASDSLCKLRFDSNTALNPR